MNSPDFVTFVPWPKAIELSVLRLLGRRQSRRGVGGHRPDQGECRARRPLHD